MTYPWILLDATTRPGGLTTRVHTAAGPVTTGRLVVETLGHQWLPPTGDDHDHTVIEWTGGEITVHTSRQNFTPMYTWTDERRGRLLMSTDLASLTAEPLNLTGWPDPRELIPRIREVRAGIHQLPAHHTIRYTADLQPTRVERPGWTPRTIRGETPGEAGARQIDALHRDLAALAGHGPVTALISGGVDSGTVAALAQQAGILDGVATLGTAWGDEHAEAAELAEHLGHPLRYVLLTEDDILDALPDTIRMLGEPGKETVAIATNLVALYRRGEIPTGTLLTGYGSDLLNSGLRVDAAVLDDLRSAVATQLAQATTTGEFSGITAAAYGYAVRHPFWSSGVIQAALDTDPSLMGHNGREKGHLREAATRYLPAGVAWRPKRALHRGSGVDDNLDHAIARRLGTPIVDVPRLYEFIDAELVRALGESPGQPVDGRACLDAAMIAYTANV